MNIIVELHNPKGMAIKVKHKITVGARDKLLLELDDLKSNKRHEIAEKIKESRAFGDLSENSEYDEAKNEQAKLEARINEIENILNNSDIISESDISTDTVGIGCRVKVYDKKYKEEIDFIIVGSAEAHPLENKISDESPIGLQLLGKKVGNIASAQTPDGVIQFKILEISLP